MQYIIFFIAAIAFSVLINGLFLKFSRTMGTKNNPGGTEIRWGNTSKPAFGGISFYNNESIDILWSSYGNTSQLLDLYYSSSRIVDGIIDTTKYFPKSCVRTDGWTLIAEDIENTGSFTWDLGGLATTDSLRIKIIESKSNPACDINGHYISINSPSRTTRAAFNKMIRN